jgi:hypothetical protein
MQRLIERWTDVCWMVLLACLLVAGLIGSGLLLAHASAGPALFTANPPAAAGPAAPASALDASTADNLTVGLDSTGAPILLP